MKSRRSVIATLGVMTVGSFAGCTDDGTETPTDNTTSTDSETEAPTDSTDGETETSTDSTSDSNQSFNFQGRWPAAGGTQQWTWSVDASSHPSPPFTEAWRSGQNTGDPALMDTERIYLERDNITRALDPATGEELWRQSNFRPTGVAGGYVVSLDPRDGVLDAETGERVRGPIGDGTYLGFTKAAWSSDWIYGFDNPGNGTTNVVRLHDLVSGDLIWETAIPEDLSADSISPIDGYARSSNTVFAYVSSGRDDPGSILGIDIETGEVRWTHHREEGDEDRNRGWGGIVGDAFLLHEEVSDNMVRFKGISHETGEQLWQTEMGNRLGGSVFIDDVRIVNSGDEVTAYSLASGDQLWQVAPEVGGSSREFGRGDRYYISGSQPDSAGFVTKVYNLDGELQWESTDIATYRATSQALLGMVGNLRNFEFGMLIEG